MHWSVMKTSPPITPAVIHPRDESFCQRRRNPESLSFATKNLSTYFRTTGNMKGIKVAEIFLILPIPSASSRQVWSEADRWLQGHEFKKTPEVLEGFQCKDQVTTAKPHRNSRKDRGLSQLPSSIMITVRHHDCKKHIAAKYFSL